MEILTIDHLQLAIPPGSEAKARGFYGGLPGLQQVEKPEALAPRGGCWFLTGRVHLHLGVQSDFVPSSKGHPAFLVSNLAALEEKLRQAGVEVDMDHTIEDRRRFYIQDPFGNRLEFIEDGDGFSQRDWTH